MGQFEIIEALEKAKKPLSRSEIAELINANACHVSHHLRTLVIHQEVKIIEIDRIQAKAFFKGKAPSRRMRLYYV
jgi:DNA-binding IclR family transcriptional regulator